LPKERLFGAAFASPVGTLIAIASEKGLRVVSFNLEDLAEVRQEASPALDAFTGWLRTYLARDFDRLPSVALDMQGTPFDLQVWAALVRIRPGRTVSYGDIATEVCRPGAARAVGAAAGRNPVAIVVPCHRVVAADGRLNGYAGGIERKAWLLRHERALMF
jgi:O-6-methylguanine DNA methyltransferase